MKRYLFAIAVVTALAVLPAAGAGNVRAQKTQFVVLYAEGASLGSARAAVRAAGGTIVKENAAVGVATVMSANRTLRDRRRRPGSARRRRTECADRQGAGPDAEGRRRRATHRRGADGRVEGGEGEKWHARLSRCSVGRAARRRSSGTWR